MQLYLSDERNLKYVLEACGLSLDELEAIVGRFAKHSHRAGQLRGEYCEDVSGCYIRHHFTKKILWRLN